LIQSTVRSYGTTGAYNYHNNMVLVSIHPFAVRKIFLLAIAVLGFSSALCFADPLFMTRQYGAASDHTGSARPAITPRATLDRSSVIWLSFENSPERSKAIRAVAFLSPFEDATREMDPIISTSIVAGFQRFTVSARSEVGSNSLPSGIESVLSSGL
jgi:hypothetical protein